jgi:hypothetical protein
MSNKEVRQPTQCLIPDVAAERILKAGYGEDDSLQQLTERGKLLLLLLRPRLCAVALLLYTVVAATPLLLRWSLSLFRAVALLLCTVVAASLLLRWSLSLLLWAVTSLLGAAAATIIVMFQSPLLRAVAAVCPFLGSFPAYLWFFSLLRFWRLPWQTISARQFQLHKENS